MKEKVSKHIPSYPIRLFPVKAMFHAMRAYRFKPTIIAVVLAKFDSYFRHICFHSKTYMFITPFLLRSKKMLVLDLGGANNICQN